MFSFNADSGEILIYDEIGPAYWGLIDSGMVGQALAAMQGKHVTIRLNTPGGSVDEGVAIYNALKRHEGGVTTIVDSLAASMGSYLLQAGERRIVASNALVMIHDPWTIAFGNSSELRKSAEVLDKYSQRMIPDYAKSSGKTEDEITAIMLEETWYTGQQIVDAGFADEIGLESTVKPETKSLAKMCRNAPPPSLFETRKVEAEKPFKRREAARAAAAACSKEYGLI